MVHTRRVSLLRRRQGREARRKVTIEGSVISLAVSKNTRRVFSLRIVGKGAPHREDKKALISQEETSYPPLAGSSSAP